jgi:hypothetical protein
MAKPQTSAPRDENTFPKNTPRGAAFEFQGGVFERNTVQGQTGVPAQDRGGGGGVGSDWAGNRSAEHSLANVELE